jgi:DNA invertase Pin-like site-specific DNA recombinase
MIKNARGTMPEKGTLAVIYARVSPSPTSATSESCDDQIRLLKEYCWKKGWKIAGIFKDESISGGTNWDERPGLVSALAACKKGYVLVIEQFDRLFRDTANAMAFRSLMMTMGVEMRSLNEEFACNDDPMSEFMQVVLFALAELQRKMISVRTKARMQTKKKEGKKISQHCQFGTRVDPHNRGRIIRDESECQTIDLVRKKHIEGYSMRGIARFMNEKGIAHRASKQWTHRHVQRILKREGLY